MVNKHPKFEKNHITGKFMTKQNLTIQEILAKAEKELAPYQHEFLKEPQEPNIDWENARFNAKEFAMYCFNCSDFYIHNGDGICPKCKK